MRGKSKLAPVIVTRFETDKGEGLGNLVDIEEGSRRPRHPLPALSDLRAQGKPLASGKPTAEPGLFFCGAIASPTGQLREIGIEAQRIAKMAKGIAMARSQSASSP
jgi:hypothetical protein